MNKTKVLIIVPAYNEEDCIEKVIPILKKSPYDYIVINDGSTDRTAQILDNLKSNHIGLSHNLGIGGAVQTGYKYAYQNGYDIAVQFDADGQHSIEYIDSIIEPIINGEADFVIGSRFINKAATKYRSTALRQVGIKALSGIIKFLSGKRIFDPTSGFRAAGRDIIKKFAFDYPLEYPEPISDYVLVKSGYKVKEVQVSMNARMGGHSSIHSWKSLYYMINVFLSLLLIKVRREK